MELGHKTPQSFWSAWTELMTQRFFVNHLVPVTSDGTDDMMSQSNGTKTPVTFTSVTHQWDESYFLVNDVAWCSIRSVCVGSLGLNWNFPAENSVSGVPTVFSTNPWISAHLTATESNWLE